MKPVHVTKATFQAEVLDADVPVVVDFWAPWCGPCKAIAPLLDRLALEHAGRVKIVKVNIDEERELGSAFHVQSIPTLVTLHHGEVVDVTVGFRGPAALASQVAGLAAAA